MRRGLIADNPRTPLNFEQLSKRLCHTKCPDTKRPNQRPSCETPTVNEVPSKPSQGLRWKCEAAHPNDIGLPCGFANAKQASP